MLENFNSVLRIAPMMGRSGWCRRSRRFCSRLWCLAQRGSPSNQPYRLLQGTMQFLLI